MTNIIIKTGISMDFYIFLYDDPIFVRICFVSHRMDIIIKQIVFCRFHQSHVTL